jgi:hypothetical protein
VILYELLTLRRPYRLTSHSWTELERTICHSVPEPPGSLVPSLRGDLEKIILMAMRKEPSRRYGSVELFAEDIRRYLNHIPVAAAADSVVYRMRKFIRRHRLSFGAGTLVAASLLGGILLTARQARIARAAQFRAETQTYIANLTAADLNLRSGNVLTASERLYACPKTLRGWEWRYLLRQCDLSLTRLYEGETIPVDSAAFAVSPDGRRIFWNDLHTVYSWDAETGEPSRRFSGFGSILSISRDGRRVVTKTYTGARGDRFRAAHGRPRIAAARLAIPWSRLAGAARDLR